MFKFLKIIFLPTCFCALAMCVGGIFISGCDETTVKRKKNSATSSAQEGLESDPLQQDLLFSLQQDLRALRTESKAQTENIQRLSTDIQKEKSANNDKLSQVMTRVESLNKRFEALDDQPHGSQNTPHR